MKIKVLFLLIILGCISCDLDEIKTISVNELSEVLKNNNVQLVDVRTQKEYNLGYIDNAQLIDVKSNNFENIALEKLDKNKPVYIYCRSGKRGKTACETLKEKGFTVYNLEGGFLKWKTKNK